MNNITANISSTDFQKMISYAQAAHAEHGTEISGYAPVHLLNDGTMIVKTPSILKQECSATETVLQKESIVEYVDTIALENRKLLPDNLMFCWWHSHHTMKAYFSATDEATIKEYAEKGPSLAIVVNNKGEYDARYSLPVEVHNGLTHIIDFDVELNIVNEDIDQTEIKNEIKKYLTVKKFSYTNGFKTKWENYKGTTQGTLFGKDIGGPPYGGWYDAEDEYRMNYELNDMPQYMKDEQQLLVDRGIVQAPKEDIVEKPKKPKKLIKANTLLSREINNEEDNQNNKDEIINNIDHCIQNWHLEEHDVDDMGTRELEYVVDLIKGLQINHQMKLHLPSSMDSLTCFNDLLMQETTGDYDESAYSEISKYI